jgi:hypothetical protein|tara:strand:+ start:553 stop:801 length:249 start_codon:yes stop_codon:yes gene_type:complete
MPDFYTHTTEVAVGSALGTNKGILIKAGTVKTVVTAHAYSGDSAGATADMEIAVNADESMVVPVEVHTYHAGTNSPKVYRLR